MSWVESHETAVGIPDINYCYYGVEGWLELKCGPDIEVRAAQVTWMEARIKAGGFPLILVQYEDMFYVVPGSEAQALRDDPHEENVIRRAKAMWQNVGWPAHFLRAMKNARRYYD